MGLFFHDGAAATTIVQEFRSRTGARLGEIRRQPDGTCDLYDKHQRRQGWSREDPVDGKTDLYDTRGRRLFQMVPGEKRITTTA